MHTGLFLHVHIVKQGANTWHVSTTMYGDNPTTSKMTFDNIKEVILAKERNFFHLSEEPRFRPS